MLLLSKNLNKVNFLLCMALKKSLETEELEYEVPLCLKPKYANGKKNSFCLKKINEKSECL